MVTKDTVPRWLRPVEPGYSANCRVEVDPALCANEKTARSLGECVKHIEREVSVFVASSYPATLAAEILKGRERQSPRPDTSGDGRGSLGAIRGRACWRAKRFEPKDRMAGT